jgi:hypothetical protein
MARLRIEDANGNVDLDAYQPFVETLFYKDGGGNFPNFTTYVGKPPPQRADVLKTFVPNYPNGALIRQMLDDETTTEPIANGNCHINGDPDKLSNGHNPSQVTVPMPHKPIEDFRYLQKYARKIWELYDPNDAVNEKATKFLFGVMLLTRCR